MTEDEGPRDRGRDASSVSIPVFTLTVLGAVIAVLGLFAAGELAVVIVGLAAVAVAGVIQVIGSRR